MINSFWDWVGTGLGLFCIAQTSTDVMIGEQPPWWAQFGAAILICVGIIYLMIKYLAPKLDSIKETADSNEQALASLAKSVEAAFENNTETNKRLLDLLEKHIVNSGKENKHDDNNRE